MKTRAWLPALGLVLTVAACGSSGGGSSASPSASSSSSSSPSTSATPGKSLDASSASATTPSASVASGPAVASPNGEFAVVLPTGWRQDTAIAAKVKAVTAYLGPVRNSFAANVNVVREDLPSGIDLEQYRAKSLAALRAAIPITNLTPDTKLKVDGDDALEYSFEDTQQGRQLMQRQTVVLHGAVAYTITYTATKPDFAASSAAGHSIVASWRWGS